MKLHHFYHIYADGKWEQPVSQHFKSLIISKLYESLNSSIKIGIVGTNNNVENVKNFLQQNNYNYEIIDIKENGWEQITHQKMYDYSHYNDGYVLYAHTKGSSNQEYPNIPWRETMTKYNILNWKNCINKLDEGYETVGIYWIKSPSPEHIGHNNFYAGTFWWTSLSFIRNLPPPNYEHRHKAEGWIGINEHIKPIKSFSFIEGWPGNYEELILE